MKTAVNLALQAVVVAGGVALAQQTEGAQLLGIVGDDADAAEGNDTAVVGGVGGWLDIVTRHDTEGTAPVATDGINLVTFDSGMEVETAVGIDITEGYGIGIAVVARQGKYA